MRLLRQSCANSAKKECLILLWALLALVFLLPTEGLAQEGGEPYPPAAESHPKEHHVESPLTAVWKWLNFLILFGGLGWYLRKPLRGFLDSRARAIEEGLANARQAKELASTKLSEIETRLARLDQEIVHLKEQASREAEDERTRILESAKLEAQKILDLARREIDGLQKSARLELKAHLASLAVKLAEERLQRSVGPDENKKIIQQFLQTLNTAKLEERPSSKVGSEVLPLQKV
jgi:F-type H+-transporting ATPase subunit b